MNCNATTLPGGVEHLGDGGLQALMRVRCLEPCRNGPDQGVDRALPDLDIDLPCRR